MAASKDINDSFKFIIDRVHNSNREPYLSGIVTKRKKVDSAGNIIKNASLLKIAGMLGGIGKWFKYGLPTGLVAAGGTAAAMSGVGNMKAPEQPAPTNFGNKCNNGVC